MKIQKAKRQGGFTAVKSEIGRGTSIEIYLPALKSAPLSDLAVSQEAADFRGCETILLVEDDARIRALCERILRLRGYKVLMAEDGQSALRLIGTTSEPLHLLLTDVVMPGMSGKELFAEAKNRLPSLKVLYISGYSHDVIADRGILNEDVGLVQKAFTIETLTNKVRTVLDRGRVGDEV